MLLNEKIKLFLSSFFFFSFFRSDYLQFYINLVKNFVAFALKRLDVPKRSSTLAEFLAPDHNSHCSVLTEVEFHQFH